MAGNEGQLDGHQDHVDEHKMVVEWERRVKLGAIARCQISPRKEELCKRGGGKLRLLMAKLLEL